MKLFDAQIQRSLSLLKSLPGHKIIPVEDWPEAGSQNLVLRGEMAYELGGANLPALSALYFTSSKDQVDGDHVWLYGPDLGDLEKDASYARIAIIRVAEEGLGGRDAIYTAMRKIEYTRYHIHPKGFMMRISAANGREPVRISRKNLNEGLDFSKAADHFIKAYRKHTQVLGVRLIFITHQDFPYAELNTIILQAETITESLDLLSRNLKMDCTACNLKPVCDEVEGLKELHFSQK